MMIGVISDTHDNLEVIRKVKTRLKELNVSYLIHLGDFVSPFAFKEVFSGFENRGVGVIGNNDGEIHLLSRIANRMNIELFDRIGTLEIEETKFLLMHGFSNTNFTIDLARNLASSGKYDAVLFGHTHEFHFERIGEILILNPGEASGWLTGYKSMAVIDTSSKEVYKISL